MEPPPENETLEDFLLRTRAVMEHIEVDQRTLVLVRYPGETTVSVELPAPPGLGQGQQGLWVANAFRLGDDRWPPCLYWNHKHASWLGRNDHDSTGRPVREQIAYLARGFWHAR